MRRVPRGEMQEKHLGYGPVHAPCVGGCHAQEDANGRHDVLHAEVAVEVGDTQAFEVAHQTEGHQESRVLIGRLSTLVVHDPRACEKSLPCPELQERKKGR